MAKSRVEKIELRKLSEKASLWGTPETDETGAVKRDSQGKVVMSDIFFRYHVKPVVVVNETGQPNYTLSREAMAMLEYTDLHARHPNALMALTAVQHRGLDVDVDTEYADYGAFTRVCTTIPESDRTNAAKSIARQVFAGLCYYDAVHRKAHGNISPKTVFLRRDGTVKLGLFGLIDPSAQQNIQNHEILHGPYCPPEKRKDPMIDSDNDLDSVIIASEARDSKLKRDSKADVWATGVLLVATKMGITLIPPSGPDASPEKWNAYRNDVRKFEDMLRQPDGLQKLFNREEDWTLLNLVHGCLEANPERRVSLNWAAAWTMREGIKPAANATAAKQDPFASNAPKLSSPYGLPTECAGLISAVAHLNEEMGKNSPTHDRIQDALNAVMNAWRVERAAVSKNATKKKKALLESATEERNPVLTNEGMSEEEKKQERDKIKATIQAGIEKIDNEMHKKIGDIEKSMREIIKAHESPAMEAFRNIMPILLQSQEAHKQAPAKQATVAVHAAAPAHAGERVASLEQTAARQPVTLSSICNRIATQININSASVVNCEAQDEIDDSSSIKVTFLDLTSGEKILKQFNNPQLAIDYLVQVAADANDNEITPRVTIEAGGPLINLPSDNPRNATVTDAHDYLQRYIDEVNTQNIARL